MTLIISAVVDRAILVTTDSSTGISPQGVLGGEKVLQWSASHLLLTAYGYLDQPLLELDTRALGKAFAGDRSHAEQTAVLLAALNAHAHVHNQGGKSATCLLFGFDAGSAIVSVLESANGSGSWGVAAGSTPELIAGYLETIGLTPHSGRVDHSPAFATRAAFETWSQSKVAEAESWLLTRGFLPTVLSPGRTYSLEPGP